MVEPPWWGRRTRPWDATITAAAVGLCTLGLTGCGVVPKSRLDDCHRLSQTLQADNTRLKDQAVNLRAQNQDLNQRAVDDGRRIRLQQEEIQRLVQSVSAYQQEREQVTAAFERLKSQIRTAAAMPEAAPAAVAAAGRQSGP
jgi:chemotaxis protein MotB